MALQVYNSLTRRKEEFVPLHEGFVGIYVCGPTVYDDAHIGHAKTYVSFDVIVRYLRYLGYKVRYVQNITDVGHLLDTGEDRIIKGAMLRKVEPMELVEIYTRRYFEDMDALGIQRPNISPRASGHIPEQIELVKTLLKKGYAYEVNGSVYFEVAKFPEYGKLSGRRVEELMEGARVEVREEKRHPADFALWKRAEPGHILRWPSPWGWGYPGWHLECSVMSTKYLGQPFDIHGGGVELKFPHHECEIAQAEAARGVPFARYWLHTGMLMVSGQEMHRSLGNLIPLREAFKQHSPMTIRFFILSGHYRSPLDYTDGALSAAARGLERLHGAVRAVRERLRSADLADKTDEAFAAKLAEYKARFLEAMDDDFNTAAAIGVLFDLTKEVNSLLSSGEEVGRGTLEAIDGLYRELGGDILGLIPEEFAEERALGLEEDLIELLIETRQKLREAKQWELADGIRARLAELGITLEDTPKGTRWRRVKFHNARPNGGAK
ncbi:MAG TPA: cysteine--tRNA ligase [Chloroflexi bacterium]|nr:cysteine--tRNA ligase [Chloroflexota bacterium]